MHIQRISLNLYMIVLHRPSKVKLLRELLRSHVYNVTVYVVNLIRISWAITAIRAIYKSKTGKLTTYFRTMLLNNTYFSLKLSTFTIRYQCKMTSGISHDLIAYRAGDPTPLTLLVRVLLPLYLTCFCPCLPPLYSPGLPHSHAHASLSPLFSPLPVWDV